MNNEVLVVIADDTPMGTLMAVAEDMGKEIGAIVVGPRERAELVASLNVSKVKWFHAESETPAEAFSSAVAGLVSEHTPKIVLATNASAARSILGAVAARIDAAVTSSVISAELMDSSILVNRSVAERRAVETLETSKPVVALVQDGADDLVRADASAPIEEVSDAATSNLKIIATHDDSGCGVNLANADRVVGAGRGIVSKEELALVKDFAQVLNAEMACSLSLCDDYRWFEHSCVVGTSTQRISPRLYISVGISGQPQHMTGVRGAKTIVAINNDPEAPIFKDCAYGIVGDLTKVVPALTSALSKN